MSFSRETIDFNEWVHGRIERISKLNGKKITRISEEFAVFLEVSHLYFGFEFLTWAIDQAVSRTRSNTIEISDLHH